MNQDEQFTGIKSNYSSLLELGLWLRSTALASHAGVPRFFPSTETVNRLTSTDDTQIHRQGIQITVDTQGLITTNTHTEVSCAGFQRVILEPFTYARVL